MVFIRRRAVAIVAAILILIGCAMSISPVRAAIIEFFIRVYEEFTHIFINEIHSYEDEDHEFTIYVPTHIPEDFILVQRKTDRYVLLVYEKETDYITYSQQVVEHVSIGFNTEGVQSEEVEIKGLPARFYSNQGIQSLIWYDDLYIYTVLSSLDRDTVFKIANSVDKMGNGSGP